LTGKITEYFMRLQVVLVSMEKLDPRARLARREMLVRPDQPGLREEQVRLEQLELSEKQVQLDLLVLRETLVLLGPRETVEPLVRQEQWV